MEFDRPVTHICPETPDLVKLGNIIGQFAWKPACVSHCSQQHMQCNSADYASSCFHESALTIYYIVGSAYVNQQYEGNALFLSYCNEGYANTPQCYVVRTFPALLDRR